MSVLVKVVVLSHIIVLSPQLVESEEKIKSPEQNCLNSFLCNQVNVDLEPIVKSLNNIEMSIGSISQGNNYLSFKFNKQFLWNLGGKASTRDINRKTSYPQFEQQNSYSSSNQGGSGSVSRQRLQEKLLGLKNRHKLQQILLSRRSRVKGVRSNLRRGGYGISGFKSEPRQSLQERLLGLKNRHKLQQILKSRQRVKGLQGNQSGDHGSYNNGRIENSSRRQQYQGIERYVPRLLT